MIPQRDRLKLVLNTLFNEINDPHGICEDLTGRGHWGSGDVQVVLKEAADCEKVLPLVIQAYKKHNPEAALLQR